MSHYRAYSTREQAVEAGVSFYQMLTTGMLFNDPKESVAIIDTLAGGFLSVVPGHPEMFASGGPDTDEEGSASDSIELIVEECGCDCDELETQIHNTLRETENPSAESSAKFGAVNPVLLMLLQQGLQWILALMKLRNS